MPDPHPFEEGAVLTTHNLRTRYSNPARKAASLVREGALAKVQGGLYFVPRRTRWGPMPPRAEALLSKWLDGEQGQAWVFTGSAAWNALELGTTAVQAERYVYNHKRSGHFDLAGHQLQLRRVPFPADPPLEWFVVDLLNHYREAAADLVELGRKLARALASGRFDSARLTELAAEYGRKWTQQAVADAIAQSSTT
jgi:hypothetical protein